MNFLLSLEIEASIIARACFSVRKARSMTVLSSICKWTSRDPTLIPGVCWMMPGFPDSRLKKRRMHSLLSLFHPNSHPRGAPNPSVTSDCMWGERARERARGEGGLNFKVQLNIIGMGQSPLMVVYSREGLLCRLDSFQYIIDHFLR